MKKYLIIGIIVIGIVALGYLGYKEISNDGLFGETATTSETTTTETLVEPLAIPPSTQIEDEFPELDNQNAPSGYLYAQNVYAVSDKSNTGWKRDDDGTTNLYQQTIKNTGTGDYKTDASSSFVYQAEIENTTLTGPIEVLTLYVRGTKSATGGQTKTLTAKLYVNSVAVITLSWTNAELETGWTTKWASAVGSWTQTQINAAYVETTSTTTGSDTTETFTASGTWTAPEGVSTVSAECWGGGGGGGIIAASGGGGGGGGAYASAVVNVTSGTGYSYTVGAAGVADTAAGGGDTSFNTNSCIGDGGLGTIDATGALGGTTANSTGDTKYKGGDGKAGHTTGDNGGGGGGAGGSVGAGADGVAAVSGATIGGNGGAGNAGSGGTAGQGVTASNGTDGGASQEGGGGGGGGANGKYGGVGGATGGGGGGGEITGGQTGGLGQVKLTYGIRRAVLVSSIRIYVEDQNSLVDNFDSYNDGDLNGQGSWSGSVNFDVQGTTVKAGAKAVKSTVTAWSTIDKSFTLEAAGRQAFHFRGSNTAVHGVIILREGTGDKYALSFGEPNHVGKIAYYKSGGVLEDVGDFVANTWYKIEIEWRSSDKYGRVTIDDGTPSAWMTPWNAYTSGVDKVRMGQQYNDIGPYDFYFDELSDPNVVVAVPPEDPPSIWIQD